MTELQQHIEPGSLVFIVPPKDNHVEIIYFEEDKEIGSTGLLHDSKMIYFIDYFLGSKDLCKILIDGRPAWCQTQYIRREDGP